MLILNLINNRSSLSHTVDWQKTILEERKWNSTSKNLRGHQKSLSSLRTCSSVTNSTTVKGPCLEMVGTNPLYNANGPSARTVFNAQSRAPEYGASAPASTFMFITLVFITSTGFDATAATNPAEKLAVTWVPSPSFITPFSSIISLIWSYEASCEAVTNMARFIVRDEPRHRLAIPSWRAMRFMASTTLV